MKTWLYLIALSWLCFSATNKEPQKVFDVHLHGAKDMKSQLTSLKVAGVYKGAISTSWDGQSTYRDQSDVSLLFGLMFPCPDGKVPYSQQACFSHGKDWPDPVWVEEQIKANKIDFLGEVLSQYYGISSSDSLLDPYFALAQQYSLPVGIHTGGAGPGHGSSHFKMEMGNPLLLDRMLKRFAGMKVWIMHSGDGFYKQTLDIMTSHKHVYADVSVISNPAIVAPERFYLIMKSFIEAGLEDRLMFGSDNGDIHQVIASIKALDFLSHKQKQKIFYKNAERFFAKKTNDK
jgi:hypothetical protein